MGRDEAVQRADHAERGRNTWESASRGWQADFEAERTAHAATRARIAELEARPEPAADVVEKLAEIAWNAEGTVAPYSAASWADVDGIVKDMGRAGIRAVLTALAAMGEEAAESALGMSEPWPTYRAVDRLCDAADTLLGRHDYDGHGYEEIIEALRVTRERLPALSRLSPVIGALRARVAELEARLAEVDSRVAGWEAAARESDTMGAGYREGLRACAKELRKVLKRGAS